MFIIDILCIIQKEDIKFPTWQEYLAVWIYLNSWITAGTVKIPLSSHDTINETRQQVIYNGSLVNFLVTEEGRRLIWEGYTYTFWPPDAGGAFCVHAVHWLSTNLLALVNASRVDPCWLFKSKLSMSVSDFDITSLSTTFVIVDWKNKRLFMTDLILKSLWVSCFWSTFYSDINSPALGTCFGLSH